MRIKAPVLICTLNRYDHFKNCVDSLSKCTDAEETDLFIGLDYPSKEDHWKGYRKINEFLRTIHGFKTVNVIRRTINFGVQKNFLEAQSEIFKRYDRIIVSEDDNVFSLDFLSFINQGLTIYNNRKEVFYISGYNYPIDMPKHYKSDIYLWQGFSGWGMGVWRDRWQEIQWDESIIEDSVRNFLKRIRKVIALNKKANHYIPALIDMLEKKTIHGDVYICLHQFQNNLCSVFPAISRVRNLGHDGSGVNCGSLEDNIYFRQEIYTGSGVYDMPINIEPDEEINRILMKHFRRSYKSQIKTAGKLLLINTGLNKVIYPFFSCFK